MRRDCLRPGYPQAVAHDVNAGARLTVSVCIPYGGSDEHRERALQYVTGRYEELGYEVRVGVGDSLAWCKAAAVQDAVGRASGDVLIVADCDVWADDLSEAVRAVERGARWAVPHQQVRRLDETATAQVLAGTPPRRDMPLARRPYAGIVGGGIVVLPRSLYEECPLDPRFVGWGGEDNAWGYALVTLAGRRYRCHGILWHLWHPTARHDQAPYGDNDALTSRYREAAGNIDAMRALIEEGHAWASNGSLSGPSPSSDPTP